VDADVMLAAMLTGWLEAQTQPRHLARTLLRDTPDAPPRPALTQFAWELPGTEPFAA